jgi:hypothetical protein
MRKESAMTDSIPEDIQAFLGQWAAAEHTGASLTPQEA